MKICMFVNNQISSDPRVKREAVSLTKAGHQVIVIGKPGAGLSAKEQWEGIDFLRVAPLFFKILQKFTHKPVEPAVCEAGPSGYHLQKNHDGCKNFIKFFTFWINDFLSLLTWIPKALKLKADIYHAHDLNTLFCGYICSRLAGKKLVYDSHELWIEWQRNKCKAYWLKIIWWKCVEKHCIEAADLVVTVSDGIADELKQMYNIDRPLVVRNCAPLKPVVKSDKLRNEIGGDKSRVIILYQGGFADGRGLEETILAAKQVPDADFVLMGHESAYKNKIKQMVADTKLSNVFILPKVSLEELWEYTCSADIGMVLTQPVCKSYEITLSNKVFEYMAAGIAIIASNLAEHQRLASQTDAIALVDPYDPHNIAAELNSLLQQPERIKQMGENSKKWALEEYNVSKEMEKLSAAYQMLK